MKEKHFHKLLLICKAGTLLILTFLPFLAFSEKIIRTIRETQNNICDICGMSAEPLTVHHKIPRSKNGSDKIDNAVGLCPRCHRLVDKLAQQGVSYENAKNWFFTL